MADSLFLMSPKTGSGSGPETDSKNFSDQEKRSTHENDDVVTVDASGSKLQRRLQSRHLQMIAIGMLSDAKRPSVTHQTTDVN